MARATGGLSEEDRIKILEGLAQDKDLKATQRLRAIEELGRIEARRAAARQPEVEDDLPPDPMADLQFAEDELESRRRRRRRSAAAAG